MVRQNRITLKPGESTTLFPTSCSTGEIRWIYDDRIESVVQEDTGGGLKLVDSGADPLVPGFFRIVATWKNETGGDVEEEYLVRMQSASESALSSEADPGTAASTPAITPAQPMPAPHSTAGSVRRDATEKNDVAIQHAEPPADDGFSTTSIPSPGGLSTGEYFLQVRRNDVDVPRAHADVPRDRTLYIGRGADCDLCLAQHFSDERIAQRCSRRQLEVFWSDRKIYAKNVGTNAVVLVHATNRDILPAGSCVPWPVNACLQVPGELELQLRRA